jgi:hypothetical protein
VGAEIYYMWVPNDYSFYGLMVTIEKEKQFVYPDSATIYITTFENTPNANKIKLLGDSVYNFRFQNRELVKEINSLLDTVYEPVLPDTFELKGIDDAKMYWKDKKIGEVAIGYFNVSKAKLKLFESSLQTLELRKTSINKVEQ